MSVGYHRGNHTSTVSFEDGRLVVARSVTSVHQRARWNAEAPVRVRAMPRDVKSRQERERVKSQDGAHERGATAEAAPPRAAREMRINREGLEEHGFDLDCPQCKYIIKYEKRDVDSSTAHNAAKDR